MSEENTIPNPLGTEKINTLLIKYSIPTILTLLVNCSYNIIDQIFIGQGVGVTGVAATNIAFPFTTICIALALLIGDGCASNISLSLGQQDKDTANRTFGNSFSMLIISGLTIVLLSLTFIKPLVLLFGASATVLQSAMDYSGIIIIGLPFMIINVSFAAIIRADGNPKYTMKSMIIGAIINVILDPIFIFVLDMGVIGAGIATIIGQIVSALICIAYIPRFKNIKFQKKYMIIKPSTSLKVLSLGIPSFSTQVATAATQIVMNNLMTTYGAVSIYSSEIALSSYGIMMKVYQISHSMFVGVSSGIQPISGYNFGAKQYDRVRQTYKSAAIIAITISTVWFLIFQLFGGQIGAAFISNNPLHKEFSTYCFRIYMMGFILYGLPIVTTSFFQAIGKPGKAIIISLSRQIVFLIPLALILSNNFGLFGALSAAPIADILTFLLTITFIIIEFRGWKKNNMI